MPSDPPSLEQAVRSRLDSLTKPPGSLGALEDIALQFSFIKRELMPSSARKAVYVFCGDHGIAVENVSGYPQAVTRQMVANFIAGGAAISVIARSLEAVTVVVDTGVCGEAIAGVVNRKIAQGTQNFAVAPAMTREQAVDSLMIGRDSAEAAAQRFDLVALGEMGIGNTSVAAALLSVFSKRDPEETVGKGTGISEESVRHKTEVIRKALALHSPDPNDPIGVLASVGGFEIGAIAGFILRAHELRLPVVLDGFPCCAAALIAQAINPEATRNVFFSHLSSERGHTKALKELGGRPYLNLDMRLGEASGAAIMMWIIDIAVRLYREMATFAEAGVSSASDPAG